MNRAMLRQLAQDRIADAAALLAAGRWTGAYYLAGYAVECALKACIMAYVEASGIIFSDKKFAEKCWTHNLEVLVGQASLTSLLNADLAANPNLTANWVTVRYWDETSRYRQKTQAEAQALYDAITANPDGVLRWIQNHW